MKIPSSKKVEYLLNDLCVELGFCVSAKVQNRLIRFTPKSPKGLTNAIIEAEGFSIATIERALYNKVLARAQASYQDE